MAGTLCGVAGVRHAVELKRQAARLHRWETLLCRLLLLLRESTYALPDAFALAADEDKFPDQVLQTLSDGLRQTPRIPLAAQLAEQELPSPERDVLQRMAERISHGSLEVRCLAVEQATEEIALFYQDADRIAGKDARMWASLGWTMGICITILLL